MTGRLITAPRIHDGFKWLHADTSIEVSEDGTIIALHNVPALKKQASFYDGILLPAFVNVHCHLELSHMQGRIPRHTGLIPFLQQVAGLRNNYTDVQKATARHNAIKVMHNHGIIAVGDIANGTDTLDLRDLDLLHIHTFVECIGFTETHAQQRFAYAQGVLKQFAAQQQGEKILRQSLVPHAPYSVSGVLFRMIAEGAGHDSLMSIHNQETEAENAFYKDKSGTVNDLLDGLGIDYRFFEPTGISSIQSYLPHFESTPPFVFVHNTFTTGDDVRFAQKRLDDCYWCLCPNANLYIENTLPDVQMLAAHEGVNICIGTDSLASNERLCVLSELITLKEYFPELTWETLFRWATSDGAAALQMQHLGKLTPGTKPGIIQVTEDREIRWITS